MAKGPDGKNTSGRGQRDLTVRVKTAKGRPITAERSSTLAKTVVVGMDLG